jgi:LuxR family maltose regulon positive regulatory protein
LQPEQIAALENRTEGWIAGLQMAALSMQNRASSDLDSFVNTFTGSHRFVLDYLVEEALSQQPESVRSFLLATSILDRLSGSLCDAVTGQTNGQTMLEMLERDNLFVVPLDNQRRWYRYHHLFADVLQAHATATLPDQVTAWHRRASDWFAQQSSPGEAIRHALAAEDYERAAALAELAWRSMDR